MLRLLRPKAPTVAPLARSSTRTSLLAVGEQPCLVLVREEIEIPDRAVGARRLSTKNSRTKAPSFTRKTWMRR